MQCKLGATALLGALLAIGGGPELTKAAAQELPGAGITVLPSDQNLAEEWFQTYLVSLGLQDLGYDVQDSASMAMQAAYTSVANGDATFYASYWDPLHEAFWEQNGGDEKLQPVGTLVRNSIQGYLIDKKTADAHGIETINQLKDPELAKLFDIDGDGKADLYGCDPGWGCERIIEHHLDEYGLRDTVTHRQGTYVAVIADAIERINAGQPALYYTWTPLWVSAVLRPGEESEWLTVERTALPEEQADAVTEVEGIGNLGFSVNTQSVIANAAFLEQNPAARKWFELLEIPIEDINAQNMLVREGQSSKPDTLRHAEEWREEHREQWDAWIEEAKAAAQ
jgi:glycine betaine/proline transport system substrate-binding protein